MDKEHPLLRKKGNRNRYASLIEYIGYGHWLVEVHRSKDSMVVAVKEEAFRRPEQIKELRPDE